MYMTRVFHSVGQGAFYTECFSIRKNDDEIDITIVYDCGSKLGGKYVEKQIKRNFKKEQEIHALFISHLHEDHINGIPSLIEHCNVKRIFFPLISSENRFLLKAIYKSVVADENLQEFVIEFIDSPVGAIKHLLNKRDRRDHTTIELIGVKEAHGENDLTSTHDYEGVEVFNSGENAMDKIDDTLSSFWEYIPYNFKQIERIEELKEELRKNKVSLESLEKWDVEAVKLARKAYEKLEGGLNTNTMTLYSGNINSCRCSDYFWMKCVGSNIDSISTCFFRMGCLYMGDYNAKKSAEFAELKTKYQAYWNNISCIQVPHHGSKKNFNADLIEPGRICVISAGENNKYGHPNSEVINAICLRRGYPLIVTEETNSVMFLCNNQICRLIY
mgnify:CR=1 FL=1